MLPDLPTAGFGVEAQTDRPAENVDAPAQPQERLEAEAKTADLAASLARRVGVQQRTDPRLVHRVAGIGRPQTMYVRSHLDAAGSVSDATFGNRIGSVLHQLGNLPVGIASSEHRRLNVGMFVDIVGSDAVGGKPVGAKSSGVAHKTWSARRTLS